MQKISPYELSANPFQLLDKQWAMITTRVGEKTNTMTASWGGVGVLWNQPVATIYVRPQRFTRELLDESELFSLCFLPEEYRKQEAYCGKASGRDEDKLAVCGFETITLDDTPVLAPAELALTCRKLYRQELTAESFLVDRVRAAHYPNEDYHIMYIAEILGAYHL